MKRLVYTPQINAYVKSDTGIVDLTPYVTSCSVNRKVNQVSNATVTFRNPKYRDKYGNELFLFTQTWFTDRNGDLSLQPMFHPMDPIIITLTRLRGKPIQVFTGYVDTAPYVQLFPGTATIEASCTLKRLQYTYFDPGLPFVMDFLRANGWYVDSTGTMSNPTAEAKITNLVGADAPALRGVNLSSNQQQQVHRLLSEATKFNAPQLAMEAIICAAFGESNVGDDPDTFHPNGSGYYGVLQWGSGTNGSAASGIDPHDTASGAYWFLRGGHGFQAGGALHQVEIGNTDPGLIATMVEAGGESASYYGAHQSAAQAIISAWQRAVGNPSTTAAPRPAPAPTPTNSPVTDYDKLGDSSIGALLYAVLEQIGGWDRSIIFIEELPPQLGDLVYRIFTQVEAENQPGVTEIKSLLSQLIGSASYGTGSSTAPAGKSATGDTNTNASNTPAGVSTPKAPWNPASRPIANWIIPILTWAGKNGFTGTVSSGFRTKEHQQFLYDHAGTMGISTIVAVPGTSNHEKTDYPGGAIDVNSAGDAAQLISVLKNYPGSPNLVGGTLGPADPYHFSARGN